MIGGLLLFTALFLLIILRIPVFISLILSGSIGYIISFGMKSWWHFACFSFWQIISNYHVCLIPLFLLMGQIAYHSGITKYLFSATKSNNLAFSCLFTSMIFGCICGSSIATISSMSPVIYKEMKSRSYGDDIIFGILAVSGTVGVMIPPSIIIVIYGMIAEESISDLYIATIPIAIIACIGHLITIKYFSYKYPDQIPIKNDYKPNKNWRRVIIFLMIFILMISGFYTGIFTLTEIASIAIIGIVIMSIFIGNFKIINWQSVFRYTSNNTTSIISIFIGAKIFNMALSACQFPMEISDFLVNLQIHSSIIIGIMIVILILLGCVMDGIAILKIIVPLFLPILSNLNLDVSNSRLWFGIMVITITEMSLITPPFGLNLFVIRNILPSLRNVNISKAVYPFLVSDLIRILLLFKFPVIVTFLL